MGVLGCNLASLISYYDSAIRRLGARRAEPGSFLFLLLSLLEREHGLGLDFAIAEEEIGLGEVMEGLQGGDLGSGGVRELIERVGLEREVGELSLPNVLH